MTIALLLIAAPTKAQVIDKKHLVTSFGGGIGVLNLNHAPDSLRTEAALSGAITFRFAYAFSKRFSMGARFDRMGTDHSHNAIDHLHFACYQLEFVYRPWVTDRAALETSFATGTVLMSMDLFTTDLPLRSHNGAVGTGVRYVRLLNGTLGFFAGIDLINSREVVVQYYDGSSVLDAKGLPITLTWSGLRASIGSFVRF